MWLNYHICRLNTESVLFACHLYQLLLIFNYTFFTDVKEKSPMERKLYTPLTKQSGKQEAQSACRCRILSLKYSREQNGWKKESELGNYISVPGRIAGDRSLRFHSGLNTGDISVGVEVYNSLLSQPWSFRHWQIVTIPFWFSTLQHS